ncbi:MAG: four helix bundle protein [candidate division WOR-3 bacterium]
MVEARAQKPEQWVPDTLKPGSLGERLLTFATGCLKLTDRMARTASARHISSQVIRSATSAGANYQEARGAESRADFVHKLQVVLKELRETQYWLMLVQRAGLAPAGALAPLLTEADELIRMVVKSVLTAKSNTGKRG